METPLSANKATGKWTRTVNGKTVNRRLTQREVELYQEWIANDRRQRTLVAKMRDVAAKATELSSKRTSDEADEVQSQA